MKGQEEPAITEIAKGCAATAVTTSVTNMVAEVIHEFGTEEVKNKHLPKICSGEYPAGSFALTEPQAGSDAANIRTTAAKDGDSYVLNGQKSFITSGGQSGITVVWAVTDKEAKRGKGISAFVVEKGTPGFIIGKNEEKMGQRASSTNELFFEDCRIPKENLLGQEGDGFKISMMELDGGRIGIASLALGLGYAAIDYATEYAKGREQFGQPIANFQAIQWMVADSYTELDAAQLLVLRASFLKEKKLPFGKEASMAKLFASETAARLLVYRAAWLKDQGQVATRETSIAKLFATEAAARAASEAVLLHGGRGYSNEYPVERYHRDVIVTTLYEGTSEIQRHVIARSIFGRKQG